MKTSKIFRYLLALVLLVPFCQIEAEERDETTYTATYKFNYLDNRNSDTPVLSPIGVEPIGANLSNYSKNFKRSSDRPLGQNWSDRIYLEQNSTGSLEFRNFKYEIKSIKCSTIESNLFGNPSMTVVLTDYLGNDHKREKFSVSDGGSFTSKNILGRDFDAHLPGIKTISITQENSNHLYFQAANNNTTPTFTIEYFKPYITFNEKMPSALKVGNSILLNDVYSIMHPGAFTKNDVTFKVNPEDAVYAEIEDGKLVAKKAGTVHLSAIINNNGNDFDPFTINVKIYDGDYCWSQGLLYMDYDPNGKNPTTAQYSGQPYDGLRLFDANNDEERQPYGWSNFTASSNGNLTAKLTTTSSENMWRVGLGMLSYNQYVPRYASVKIAYDFTVQSSYTKHGNLSVATGAEIICFGNTPWVANVSDNFTTQYADRPSWGNSLTSLCYVYQGASKSISEKPFELSNADGKDGKDVSLYFGFKSYVCRGDGVSQTGTLTATNRKVVETTYYATIKYKKNCNDNTFGNYLPDQSGSAVGTNGTFSLNSLASQMNRPGYTFKGWNTRSDGKGTHYDDGADFCPYDPVSGGGKGPVNLYAEWEGKKVTVILDMNCRQGNSGKWSDGVNGSKREITVTMGEPMPSVNFFPQHGNGGGTGQDDKFIGFYQNSDPNNSGKEYYNAYMQSSNRWDIWNGGSPVTIYGKWWQPKQVKVVFAYPDRNIEITDYEFGSQKYSSLSGTNITTPVKAGYIFDGWYDDQYKECVYDAAGYAVKGHHWAYNKENALVWNSTADETKLSPNWIKESVSIGIEVIRDNNYEGTTYNHRYVGVHANGVKDIRTSKGPGYITVDGVNFLSTEENGNENQIKSVSLDNAPIWTFEEYPANSGTYIIYTTAQDGRRLYLGNKLNNSGDESQGYKDGALGIQTSIPDLRFSIYEEKGWICYGDGDGELYNHVLYMKDNTMWNYEDTGDNPQYKPIRILSIGNIIDGIPNSEKIITTVEDELIKAEYCYNVNKPGVSKTDADLCKGVLYVDLSSLSVIVETGSSYWSTFKNKASTNCLFFMPGTYTYNPALGDNVICKKGHGYESVADLIVTDKMPFHSPYTFNMGAYTASYSRQYSDHWGSLYLPFPVQNNSDGGMKYYKLYGADNARLAFQSIDNMTSIAANEPIAFYGSGEDFTLSSNTGVDVPASGNESQNNVPVTVKISDDIEKLALNKGGKEKPSETWSFNGVRFCKYIFGEDGNLSSDAKLGGASKSYVYYFAGDKFKYVNKNGSVKLVPFRAYFQPSSGSSSKSYSIMAIDDIEGATDITDIINGNAGESDGKIYDLLGRRVKNPLKGHLYIVGGKKKQY